MQDGGVVTSAELPCDRGKRLVCELACEVHGDLARPGDAGGPGGREELLAREPKVLAGAFLYLGNRAGGARVCSRGAGVEAIKDLLRECRRQGPRGERAEGDDADQGSLQ